MGDLGKALAGFTVGFTGSYAETMKERDTFKKEESAAKAKDLRAQSLAAMKEKNLLSRQATAREHDEQMIDVRGDKAQETAEVTSKLTDERQIAKEDRALENQPEKNAMTEEAFFSMIDAKKEKMEEEGATPQEISLATLRTLGVDTSEGISEEEVVKAATRLATSSVEGEESRRLANAEPPLTEQERISMYKTYLRAHTSIIIGEINTIAGKKALSSSDLEGGSPSEGTTALSGPESPTGSPELDKRFQVESNVADQIQKDIEGGIPIDQVRADMKADGMTDAQIDTYINRWETKYEKEGKSGFFTMGKYKGKG